MSKSEDIRRYKVRLSQIITTYGPGGIIDFMDQSLMVATPNEWKKPLKIYDERLSKRLSVKEFIFPRGEISNSGVPFVRFPTWYYCPVCARLKPIGEWEEEYLKHKEQFMRTPVCIHDNEGNYGEKVKGKKLKEYALVAPSILVACKNGHVDDFPWIEWTHIHKRCLCDNPQLKVISGSQKLGLENFKIACSCGARNSLELAFRKDIFKQYNKVFPKKSDEKGAFSCNGWLQWNMKKETCDLEPVAVLRNASNIYFPKIETSLLIPPYSDNISKLLDESDGFNHIAERVKKALKRGKIQGYFEDDFEEDLEDLSKEIGQLKNIDLVREIVKRKLDFEGNTDNKYTRNDYRYEEYNALTGVIKNHDVKSNDFRINIIDGELYKIDEIESVTLVERLREVRALIGFSRVEPIDNFSLGNETLDIIGVEETESKSIRMVRMDTIENNCYPAYEVRGEGIFIKFKRELINRWLEKNPYVVQRAKDINEKYKESFGKNNNREITAKFILLHTVAHLLIKELSFECGYSTTSLRERIYCDIPSDEFNMSGILIYTADSDSEGSLGGLVKQGNPNLLPKVFKNAIRKAQWCSYDPVCITSTAQGFKNLNKAACYNCTLLPETSCEEFNTLLDRVMVVGTLENSDIGFFKNY